MRVRTDCGGEAHLRSSWGLIIWKSQIYYRMIIWCSTCLRLLCCAISVAIFCDLACCCSARPPTQQSQYMWYGMGSLG